MDYRRIQVIAGSGGNGCLSFLQLWSNEKAGPDGGNGGNGGHVIFRVRSCQTKISSVKCDQFITGCYCHHYRLQARPVG